MSDLHDLTALEAAAAVRAKEVSPVDLVDHALGRIERLDDQIGAFVTVTPELAREQAAAAEQAVVAGRELPPLHGVPTAVKDLQQTRGIPTRFGSRLMSGNVPDFDDNVVSLMRGAGLISLGKTATPEFGFPCYTETDIGAPARTPWDTGRLAGGSSGGAAAAVASGFVPIAQGSDGGGSIRIPASVCGLVGLKPSRGRVSRGPMDIDVSGLSALGSLARTVRDAAAFLDVVSVPQPGDRDPCPPPPAGDSFLAACDREPGRLRIGRCIESPIEADIDPEVRAAWEQAGELLTGLGHEVEDVGPAFPAEAVALFETVWATGAATLPVTDEQAEHLRPLTRWLRERGRAVTGAQYASALGMLNVHSRRAIAATDRYDAILYPTLAQLPRPIGWFTDGADPAEDFERQKRFTPFTAIYNMTGQPAISLPLYQSEQGLPIGMMLVGRPRAESLLLTLGAQLEAAVGWAERRPSIWTS